MENPLKPVFILIDKNKTDLDKSFEFLFLLRTAGLFARTDFFQAVDSINPSYYVGKGKLFEIKVAKEKSDTFPNVFFPGKIEYLVLNFDVNPLQKKNIEQITGLKVIDYTSLILLIFEMNAHSKEAILQVEIAKYQYLKNQLMDGYASYAQTRGGSVRSKGVGEKQIELDRRTLSLLIKNKEKELEEIKQERRTMRVKRIKSGIPIIVVIGYTNAGKSTLMNLLLDYSKSKDNKQVYVQDELFATLETSTRLISSYRYPRFLLTDTVGFIDGLPSTLVKAFRSTLEEINEADLLIHVVDISQPYYEEHIEVTNNILKRLKVKDIPMIYLYNKVDKLRDGIPFLPSDNELYTSLIDEEDVSSVLDFIFSYLCKDWIKKEVLFPYEKNFAKFLSDNYVAKYKEKESGYQCTVYLNPRTLFNYESLLK